MASRVVGQMDEAVAEFVCSHNPGMDLGETPYTAIGNVDGLGNIIGGIVFNTFTHRDVQTHIAGIGRHWCTRRFLGEAFRYVFLQLGCRRCTALVAESNEASRRFVEKLGFVCEGLLRAYLANDEDCLVYGMLREECRWLNVGVLSNGSNGTKSQHPREPYERPAAIHVRRHAPTVIPLARGGGSGA
jgi:RimJ/RimL family protein N-acetyltransferase